MNHKIPLIDLREVALGVQFDYKPIRRKVEYTSEDIGEALGWIIIAAVIIAYTTIFVIAWGILGVLVGLIAWSQIRS